jgi:2,3-bisphosphoglycerate-independent phosphoglycerate mutase
MEKKALLVILDGWGIGDKSKSDIIYNTPTPYWDKLVATYPHSQLQASGESVGLPDGQMGNSEVGHLNIGAGRVVYQDLVKINLACRNNTILDNPAVVNAFSYAKQHNKSVHFLGLVSDGGVHSSLEHLFKLCDIAKTYEIDNTFIHCFMDGRDTDPRSGKGFISELEAHTKKSAGKIASIIGRYYAMDRDKRWERVKESYDLLVNGIGEPQTDMIAAIQKSYDNGVTDEFIKPIVNKAVDGKIKEGDVVIFFNYRNDRAKELTIVLTQKDMPEFGMQTIPNLHYCTMTPYDASFKGMNILFDKDNVNNTLGEYLSGLGKSQLHMAETEKYAHVTFFFNGGVEEPVLNETRVLIPSPSVATYDLQPEMSAPAVGDAVRTAIKNETDFIVVNFANGDMVGHTGVFEAAVKAVEAVDFELGLILEKAKELDYNVIITSDHGNCEMMKDEDGNTLTNHTVGDVYCFVISKNVKVVKTGSLNNIAPTVLKLMNLEIPKEMDEPLI